MSTTTTTTTTTKIPPTLPKHKLGKNGPEVVAIGFGAMGLSSFYGKVDSKEERFKILDRAFELGCTNWDSADIYGDSEDLIGEWFRRSGKRDEVFLATKWANKIVGNARQVNSTPEYCKEACEKSLKRLGVDYIDLYYCHRVDEKTPIEKTVEAMVELKKAGKIKYMGLSEVSSATLRRACKVHHIDAVQMEYSPFAMDVEDPTINLLNTCRELGVATVCYSPLGRGLITGQYRSPDDFEEGDFRKMSPRFSKENFPKNLKLVDQLGEIADRKACTKGQLCLAWLVAQGSDIIPIPGTKKIKYLEENISALEIKLSDDEVAEIRTLIEATEVHGARYPEGFMSSLFADTPELSSV